MQVGDYQQMLYLRFTVLHDYTDDVDSPEEYEQFFDTLKELALEDDRKENT